MSNENIAKDEQSSVKERLLKYIKAKHLNANQFLDMAGLSKTYISNMRQGIKPTTFDNNIAPNFPDLSKSWLLHGEGEMFLNSELDNDSIANNETSAIINRPQDEQMQMLYDEIKELRSQLDKQKEDNKQQAEVILEFISQERKAISDLIIDLKTTLMHKKKENT